MAAAIDEKIAEHTRATHERAGAAERLAACVQHENVVATFKRGCQPSPVSAVNAGGVGLVDKKHSVMPVGERHQVLERGAIAIHAVEAFDNDPNPSAATACPPFNYLGLERPRVVVERVSDFCPAGACAFVRACMGKRIQHDEIALLGES